MSQGEKSILTQSSACSQFGFILVKLLRSWLYLRSYVTTNRTPLMFRLLFFPRLKNLASPTLSSGISSEETLFLN